MYRKIKLQFFISTFFQSGCSSDKMHEMVARITFYLPVKEEKSAQNQIHNTLYHEEERAFL